MKAKDLQVGMEVAIGRGYTADRGIIVDVAKWVDVDSGRPSGFGNRGPRYIKVTEGSYQDGWNAAGVGVAVAVYSNEYVDVDGDRRYERVWRPRVVRLADIKMTWEQHEDARAAADLAAEARRVALDSAQQRRTMAAVALRAAAEAVCGPDVIGYGPAALIDAFTYSQWANHRATTVGVNPDVLAALFARLAAAEAQNGGNS